MKKLYFLLNQYRLLPAWLLMRWSSAWELISQDLARWMELERLECGRYTAVCHYLLLKKEFRNLVQCRLKRGSRVAAAVFGLLFKPIDTLFIVTRDIGGGLYIQHGFATIISAKSIGRNCYINQQVTIGFEGDASPVIGDNVRICAGAKVIGGVTVGSGAVIGANAVVVKDVPVGEVWGGVPAKRIK